MLHSLFLSFFKKEKFITIAIAVAKYQHFCTSFLSPNSVGQLLHVRVPKILHMVHKGHVDKMQKQAEPFLGGKLCDPLRTWKDISAVFLPVMGPRQ